MVLALKARNGGSKTSAMCAIARKLVPMLLHVMQTGEALDEAKWKAGRAMQHGHLVTVEHSAAACPRSALP